MSYLWHVCPIVQTCVFRHLKHDRLSNVPRLTLILHDIVMKLEYQDPILNVIERLISQGLEWDNKPQGDSNGEGAESRRSISR